MSDESSRRNVTFRLLRWGLCAIVLWFVGNRAAELWQDSSGNIPAFSPGWLILAAVCYLAGWLPSVWFMRSVLSRFDQHPEWLALARAYYCGHLGKYVPGKAAVLLIRSGLLKPYGVSIAQSALGVVIETLGVMAVGLAMAAALSGWVFPDSVWQALPAWLSPVREMKWIGPVSVGMATLVLIPLCAGFASRIAVRLARKELRSAAAARSNRIHPVRTRADSATSLTDADSNDSIRPGTINAGLLFRGTLAFVGAWLLFGLSLGCVLQSLGHSAESTSDCLRWTCAVAAGTSLGFIVLFAPGGLGVREGLIIAMLEPSAGGRTAIAAAALLRVVWFASEVTAAAVLYYLPTLRKGRQNGSPSAENDRA
jgi:hypothetical protein